MNRTHRCFPIAGLGLLLCSASLLAGESARLARRAPEAAGMHAAAFEFVEPLVSAAIEKGDLPGCVVLVGRGEGVVWERAFGQRQVEPEPIAMTTDTLFDLASLTKPIATATSVMILVQRGQIRLRDPVARYLPEFAPAGKEEITIEQLLTHQGGLIPDNPLSDYQHGSDVAWERIWALTPQHPPGTRFVYTDVGYLVLGKLVLRVTGQDIHSFSRDQVFAPLGMRETGYLPDEQLQQRAAPTEKQDGVWLRGTVHDPRAAALGGVAGHAGLFSTANDLAVYASMMLQPRQSGRHHVLAPATIGEMTRARDVAGNLRGLGWDMRSSYSRNRGEFFSSRAFGHGGFTGTAIWMDPELNLFVIFLSNRLHPDGRGTVNDLAGRIGTIASGAILSGQPKLAWGGRAVKRKRAAQKAAREAVRRRSPRTPVMTGIDILQRDGFRQLNGRRVGLVTNHTGVNQHGLRTAQLLSNAENVQLVALFSPEHGIAGRLDVATIDDGRDAHTAVPIYSLYGASRRPLQEQLDGVDTLVFDIQDIGTRFYTYISTMGFALEAAAEHGLRFVVLDRPNPIGGVEFDGPLLDPGRESFVGYHRLPVRHGMTCGELARLFRREKKLDVDLEVIRLAGWRRHQKWDATGLVWINPSPNMRSLTAAMLYPGIGLLETTNLSVGRGTDTPFEVIGAPWIDALQLANALRVAQLPGVSFVPVRFTPTASKFADKQCGGVNIIITNRDAFQSLRTGLEVATCLRRLYPDSWETQGYLRLLGNQALHEALQAGRSASELEKMYQTDLASFRDRRASVLLYD